MASPPEVLDKKRKTIYQVRCLPSVKMKNKISALEFLDEIYDSRLFFFVICLFYLDLVCPPPCLGQRIAKRKQRNERPAVGNVYNRSRNGAPSRKGCVVNGQMT